MNNKPVVTLLSQHEVAESNESHPEFRNPSSIERELCRASQRKNLSKLGHLVFGIRVFVTELLRQSFWHLRAALRRARTCMADGKNSYIWTQDIPGGLPRRVRFLSNDQADPQPGQRPQDNAETIQTTNDAKLEPLTAVGSSALLYRIPARTSVNATSSSSSYNFDELESFTYSNWKCSNPPLP